MWESQDKRKIMWRKTVTNSLSHGGPDSPLSHCSSVPRQENCLKWGLHQCKCCVMFWINPSPHLLIGLISQPIQCQETVIWIVQPMHLLHYLQLRMSHKYSCFTLCLGAGSSLCTSQSLETSHPHLSHFYSFPHTFYSSRYKVQNQMYQEGHLPQNQSNLLYVLDTQNNKFLML